MHPNSYRLMREFVNKYLTKKKDEQLTILDIGSRDINGSYKPLFGCPAWNYIGVDFEPGKNVNVLLTNPNFWKDSIKNSTADVVISGQALEHMPHFWLVMKEIRRIMKTGALVCVIVPSKGPIHRQPVDCYRFLPDGMRAIAKWAQLNLLELRHDENSAWGDIMFVGKKP